MWGHLGYCGPSDKPKTARPRRHAPKLGVCRLMLQPLESLPPWPRESHPTAEIRVCLPRCQGEGLSQASSWRFPPPTARTSERRQGQGPQAWRAIPLSGTAPPHSHRHRHRLHDHGRGLLLGHLLLPPFSLLPTPHGGGGAQETRPPLWGRLLCCFQEHRSGGKRKKGLGNKQESLSLGWPPAARGISLK